jgi:3-dehydroquinate dehydratase
MSEPRRGRNPAEEFAENQLLKAIEAGAKYVDLEVEAPPMMGRKIRRPASSTGRCSSARSTISRARRRRRRSSPRWKKSRRFGGEVVKIVTTATCKADVDRVMALYREVEPGTLVAFCMGPEGRESRLEALKQGAPFTYACLTPEEATAPGQWTTAEMREAVYGGFRFIDAEGLDMPASKSFAQRAIVAAALADGTSHLGGYSPCGDNESALAAANALAPR